MNEPDRRLLILEAAGRLFRHYGPFKTTVADIAREARVGVGTVYLEFRTKDSILGALSSRRHDDVLHAIERAWGDGQPAAERLAAALTARVDAFFANAEGPHGADLFGCACPGVEDAHRSFAQRERDLFTGFLRAAAERGELRAPEPARDAHTLLLAYRAFAPPSIFQSPRAQVAEELERLHRLVLDGLRT
ncbi:MAG TPA: TetR/AcrR family transcriptional regulator [Myxococcales bacterium]|mgnify:FL=1|nr:TetR/AcrR family transcriptional regulator [Myxococcales bacterium]